MENLRAAYFLVHVLAAEEAGCVCVCVLSPSLCTGSVYGFAVLNCFLWDTSLGQAAGVNSSIHLLTNGSDIRVTSNFL